jgi:hypothetical protein
MLSRGEYGARVGVPRILKLLAHFNLPALLLRQPLTGSEG